MEKPNFFEEVRRLYRENFAEKKFRYDPEHTGDWKEGSDGCTVVGKEQIKAVVEQAKLFKDLGQAIAEEKVKTAAGLSLAYIKKHFPEALEDAGYHG